MKQIRDTPPASVVTFEEFDTYRTLYDDITSNGVKIEWVDRHALGDLAVMIVERNRLVNELREKGEAYESQGDRNKIERKNPARTAIEKIRPQILSLQREFKMTPNSRKMLNHISPTPGSGESDHDGWNDV